MAADISNHTSWRDEEHLRRQDERAARAVEKDLG